MQYVSGGGCHTTATARVLLRPFLLLDPSVVVFNYEHINTTTAGVTVEAASGFACYVDIAAGISGGAAGDVCPRRAKLPRPLLFPDTVIFDYEYISSTAASVAVKATIGIARHVDIAAGISGGAVGLVVQFRAELLDPQLIPSTVIFD